MTNELDALLAQTEQEPPCGPDLEYDPAFLELEQAARGKPEQQFGETVIAAEEPAWADVGRRARALLSRTKDVRVAVLLARALVHSEGVTGLSAGLQLIQELLERFWDDIHPRLDPDDDNDPTMRLNALVPLADPETMLRDVRNAWFISSKVHGRISVRDVEVALGKAPPKAGAQSFTEDQVEAILAEVASEDESLVQSVTDASQAAKSLYRLLVDKVGSSRATDLAPLSAILGSLEQVCASVVAASMQEDAAVQEDAAAEGAAPAAKPISGEIRSRQDAIMMLDKVCTYLERNEPTNPAPLLIRRAKRLMTKNFVDILKDLAPDSVSQVEKIAGLDQE